MRVGKLFPVNNAKLSFPGFQEIGDFTSAGGEASWSLAVDGDTDKEYLIYVKNMDTADVIFMQLNGDTGTNYGYQQLRNAAGTIEATRVTNAAYMNYAYDDGVNWSMLLTPTGFIKTSFNMGCRTSTGTTIDRLIVEGYSWNNTANVTSIGWVMSSGNFTAGTRITVYARRSQ
jgi:hypothetical protein